MFSDEERCYEFWDNEFHDDILYAYFNPIHVEWSAARSDVIRGEHIRLIGMTI